MKTVYVGDTFKMPVTDSSPYYDHHYDVVCHQRSNSSTNI